MNKLCHTCNTTKSLNEFGKNKSKFDGHQTQCKSCVNTHNKAHRKPVPFKEYYQANKTKLNQKTQDWYKANKVAALKQMKQYKAANPHVARKHAAITRAKRKNATCKWDDHELNQFMINEMYKHCELLIQMTGVSHQVDHVIPISNKYVCGLHHYLNLQVLTEKANRAKGNSFSL